MLKRGEKLIISKRVVLESGIVSAGLLGNEVVLESGIVSAGIIVAKDGVIRRIITGPALEFVLRCGPKNVHDFGDAVILPGLVDSHVHVNEPGRTEWEGYVSATQAAAAGGFTTIVDMPLNSIPPTTTVDNFQNKLKTAEGKIHVDVAFWGGLIPENHDSLIPLVKAGVVGFKCFLCPSGVDEFPNVDEIAVRKALKILQNTHSLLAFHAELGDVTQAAADSDPSDYSTFLESRPETMETSAVDMVCRLCDEYQVRCHIVHASASEVITKAKLAKENGAPLSVETCHHYLTLNAENVPKGGTFFKCCPPIRSQVNQDALWSHLMAGDIPLVVSDHSPCPPDMKQGGNFLEAWGGISSLQFGLLLLWTHGTSRGLSLLSISRLLSGGPAQLCRLSKKGSIAVGKDADFVVFDPDGTSELTQQDVLHRHKMSPHLGKKLRGSVLLTMLRGEVIFRKGEAFGKPKGKALLL